MTIHSLKDLNRAYAHHIEAAKDGPIFAAQYLSSFKDKVAKI